MTANGFGQERAANDDTGHDDGRNDEILQNCLASL
jgi:hypothetical protein